ncbi:MAG: hypothetical protein KGL35_05595, partial [Bradyrhizobium sp.]|nr:hypothetical protein [Bradyrhizobium sp.]
MSTHDNWHRAFKLRAVADMVEREGLEWLRAELAKAALAPDIARDVGAALIAAIKDVDALLIRRLREAADRLDPVVTI